MIPKCFNCNEILRKDDLVFCAEKLSTFEVADFIEKHFAKSFL